MKVAIVTNQAPFVRGGAELLAEALRDQLRARAFEAEVVRIPFAWTPAERVLDHMLAARLLNVRMADRIVAMKFPAYYVKHDSKVLWLLHQFRQAYDLWGTEYGGLPSGPEGRRIRDAVVQADNALLPEAQRIYTNSAVVSSRLTRFNGIDSEVLHPPLWDASEYRCDDAEGYVFCGGRISPGKRQYLLVEAMRHVRTNTRLIVAGSPDLPEHLEQLETLVRKHDLADRVTILGRWISEEEKHDLFARSLACAYIPYDEDSYGYVTLESFHSRKPVITCDDSGGVLELVEDDATGRVVPPDPTALAEAIDSLGGDCARSAALGEAGYDRVLALDISWDRVVERLVR